VRASLARWTACAALLLAGTALAQPAAVVLVARPELADPNFRETVVLVAHTPRGDTVGVVLNRPMAERLSDVAPDFPRADAYAERLYRGGPVLPRMIVALFHSSTPPGATAFRVLPGVYLSLDPRIVDSLLEKHEGDYRLFAGFSGWAPGQLEAEMAHESWHAFPATEALLFRADTSGLWRELMEKSRSRRTLYSPP
jgi:putative transcriptional regulator